MKKNKIFAFILTTTLLLFPNSASAVWNGFDDNNNRAVPILWDSNGLYCNGSGFLYSPRIVFITAHSIFIGDDRYGVPTKKHESVWVGLPGLRVSRNSFRVESEKIIMPSNYSHRTFFTGGRQMTRSNDFAIVILKSPLPTDNKTVELLTPELHNQYINNQEEVSLKGYGANDISSKNKTCDLITPKSMKATMTQKNIVHPAFEYTTTLNFKVKPNESNICDGDSGAGYVKILSNKYIYLGAQSASIDNHNCMSWTSDINKESIVSGDPVYLYMDLIKEAEEYVKKSDAKKQIAKIKKKKSAKK